MTPRILTLDVRADFRSGLHPCDQIQNALNRIGHGETLRLLVPFEPLPLFEVAQSKGLGHEARQTPEGDWEVLFSHRPEVEEANARRLMHKITSCGCGGSATEPTEIVDVDARGLEPPQPMGENSRSAYDAARGRSLECAHGPSPHSSSPDARSAGLRGRNRGAK